MGATPPGYGRIVLGAIAILGVAMMIYLTYLHFSAAVGAFCNLGEGFSCDVVNQSVYSVVLGVPFGLIGVGYFLGLLAVATLRYDGSTLKLTAIASIMFLGPSLYLTGIEIFVLKSICIFCELSKVLMLCAAIVSALAMRPKRLDANDLTGALVFAGILALVVGTLQAVSAAGPQGKYRSFAQCLTDEGARMYGSATCSSCGKQRQLLGDAFELIIEFECDPRNPDNQAEQCVAMHIDKTPTWVFEDEAGGERLRLEPGLQPLATLSEATGCALVEDH